MIADKLGLVRPGMGMGTITKIPTDILKRDIFNPPLLTRAQGIIMQGITARPMTLSDGAASVQHVQPP